MVAVESEGLPPQMSVPEFRAVVRRIEDEVGKAMLVRTLADALSLEFSRIQFTPDLMPADITGTNILLEDQEGRRRFAFQPGPIFANLILADEINRATPKTQSALLEAMQEKT